MAILLDVVITDDTVTGVVAVVVVVVVIAVVTVLTIHIVVAIVERHSGTRHCCACCFL